MNRLVEPELLDELPPEDPQAQWSRNDLWRLNAVMGHARIVARALAKVYRGRPLRHIVEIGAGDGRFSLSLARRLVPEFSKVHLVLVDRQDIVSEETRRRIHDSDWSSEFAQADVFEWLRRPVGAADECIIANLFLHHFPEARLRELLALVAERANCFVACEPRRSGAVLAVSRWLWIIGCNAVSRHDAVASVRAGFAGEELSHLWTTEAEWRLGEGETGLFSHCFVAQRSQFRHR